MRKVVEAAIGEGKIKKTRNGDSFELNKRIGGISGYDAYFASWVEEDLDGIFLDGEDGTHFFIPDKDFEDFTKLIKTATKLCK